MTVSSGHDALPRRLREGKTILLPHLIGKAKAFFFFFFYRGPPFDKVVFLNPPVIQFINLVQGELPMLDIYVPLSLSGSGVCVRACAYVCVCGCVS